jgi:hypothetical protein
VGDGLAFPDGVELWQDPSPADWIVYRLWPWGPGHEKEPTRLGSFAPSGFEAYARILHPAYADVRGGEIVRWRTLADRRGVTLGPESTFVEVSGIPLGDTPEFDQHAPHDGWLIEKEVRSLARLLERYTSTPDQCWFCLWVGPGYWDASMGRAAQVRAEHREYFLFRGELRHAGSFPPIEGEYQSPNLWWPEDRAWCVVTEVDGYSTYLAGSRGCIDAACASRDVEAIEVSIEDRLPREWGRN